MLQQAKIVDNIVYSPYPDIRMPDGISFYDYIDEWISKHGKTTAIIDGEREMTCEDVLHEIQRYAAGFRSEGLEPGTRVCVHLSNSTEAVIATYAILAAGASVVLAKPLLKKEELLKIMKDRRTYAIVTDAVHADKVLAIHEELKLKHLFSVGTAKGFCPVSSFRTMASTAFKKHVVPHPEATAAVLTYTSGTTGEPKAAKLSHYGLISAMETMRCSEMFTKEDTVLAWSPITHISGFVYVIAGICYGSTTVIGNNTISAEDFVQTVNKHKVTTLLTFPTGFQRLVLRLESLGEKLPTIKTLTLCGTAMSEALGKKIQKVFQLETLRCGYGMSEAGGILAITPMRKQTLGTVGHPSPSSQCKVVHQQTGQALPAGQKGEILFRGPQLMMGYDDRPEETAAAIGTDGWLRTGDMGYYDEQGRMYIVERIKEMIKCMDKQVAPAEVEHLLLQSDPRLLEVVIVGVPDEEYGEAPTAFVVLKEAHRPASQEMAEELKRIVERHTAEYKHLHGGVVFVDTVPATDSGKYRRHQLRKQFTEWKTANNIHGAVVLLNGIPRTISS